jgi:hypothetical protein
METSICTASITPVHNGFSSQRVLEAMIEVMAFGDPGHTFPESYRKAITTRTSRLSPGAATSGLFFWLTWF